jgi:hypothetical protein
MKQLLTCLCVLPPLPPLPILQGAKASKGAPRCTSSSSSGNISSTLDPSFDSRPVSVSPLMTPVTPAAAAGQRPNRSGIEVTPSSCSSYSETTTPGSELSSSGRSNSSNGSNMRCLFNSLDDFSLPPAAIPAAANGADTYADPNTPQAQQQQQQQQQRQVMTTESLHSSDTQDDTLLEPATPCSGAAAAGTYTSEPARTKLSSQQQQQQQQEVWPLPGESRISSGSMQTPSVHDPHSAGQQAPADSSSDDSGGAAGAALPAGTPVPAAPSETVFSGAAGAAAAEACLLPPGAALQKPNWQQQQPPEIPVLGLDSSADGSSSSCFQYGLGLSSTSLDSSSSFCVKESPALQALIVDHQRQQQQQMAEQQQMQLMHMAHLQQQAQVGSFGSSVSAFGSSASLFGGPSPLLGPRTGSFAGSFESESLQLGPNALMHIAGSAQAQLGLQGQQLGMRPAGYTSLGLGAAPLGGAASGSFACSMGVPESPRFAGSQMHNGPQLQEQQRTMSALHHVAAGDSLCSSFDGSAGLSSNSMGRYTAGLHTGSVLGGLHLPGSVASCWAAGPNELPSSPMLFGTPPLSAAAVGNANGNGSGAGGDAAHSSSASAAANGAGLAMRGSLGRDVLPPAWLQPQHEAEQQQQHDMLMMVHAGQQLHAVQHEQRIALPSGAYSGQGASLAQPSTVSIW